MIKDVQMFTVICDNCKADANSGSDYSCWNDKNGAEDIAIESGWIKDNEKHYCSDCFYFDNEGKLRLNKHYH